jgi:hypothetical protein
VLDKRDLIGGEYTVEECRKLLCEVAVNGKLTVEDVARIFKWKYMKVYNNKGILAGIAEKEGLRFVAKVEMSRVETPEDIAERKKKRAKLMSEIYRETYSLDSRDAIVLVARNMGATSQEAKMFAKLIYTAPGSTYDLLLWSLGLNAKGEPLGE